MYGPFQLAIKYLRYWLRADNGKGHGVHSPFVFDFVTRVLNGAGDEAAYQRIEQQRRQLLNDKTLISVEDFGAGSRVIGSRQREVKQIAATSLKPKKYSQLLHRIAARYQSAKILEIGTSLGITTSYFAVSHPSATVVTMEGAAAIAGVARKQFDILGLQNIRQVQGNFDDTLQPTLAAMQSVDLAFIDGNHRFEPTMRYFEMILRHSHNDTIIILDDIYWSSEMEQAWEAVKAHQSVRLTIDLFLIGIVVLKKEILHKQQFSIRY